MLDKAEELLSRYGETEVTAQGDALTGADVNWLSAVNDPTLHLAVIIGDRESIPSAVENEVSQVIGDDPACTLASWVECEVERLETGTANKEVLTVVYQNPATKEVLVRVDSFIGEDGRACSVLATRHRDEHIDITFTEEEDPVIVDHT
jgi:hypothetical protein